MRRILSKIGLSLLLAGGSFAAAPAAQSEPIAGCVGTENIGMLCTSIDVTTSEGGYHDCIYVTFLLPECQEVNVPIPIPHVQMSCQGWVYPADLRYICIRNF